MGRPYSRLGAAWLMEGKNVAIRNKERNMGRRGILAWF